MCSINPEKRETIWWERRKWLNKTLAWFLWDFASPAFEVTQVLFERFFVSSIYDAQVITELLDIYKYLYGKQRRKEESRVDWSVRLLRKGRR